MGLLLLTLNPSQVEPDEDIYAYPDDDDVYEAAADLILRWSGSPDPDQRGNLVIPLEHFVID